VGYRQEAYALRSAYGAREGVRLNGNTVFNVLVLALLGWALVWFFTSEQFYVGQVTISGNKRVSTEVLREVSGLRGYSVFWLNPQRVAKHIEETLPPIRAVQVRYGFTDGNHLSAVASLSVQEQGEQIMWQVAGQRYWVDEEGELHPVLGLVPGATAESFEPRLMINDIRATPPERVEVEAIVAARQLAQLLPEIRAIEYAPTTGLRLRHSRGWLVLLGTGSDMARKVSVLRAMEIEFAGEGVIQPILVDLRYPESPYYRLPSDGIQGGQLGDPIGAD
jgi:cell division septal protein FtsQ